MISQSLLPEFDHEMATTRKVLERLPDEHLAWQPHEKSYSLQDLATHVVNVPGWVGITVDQDELDLAGEFPTPATGDRAALLGIFDENVRQARAKLEGASDATLLGSWTLKSGDTTLMTMPRVAVLRTFVMNHLIHHRGQLTVYLRLKDVPLPAVYGPSADDPTF
jgi:uncharacterized damage-inducible protein DinB